MEYLNELNEQQRRAVQYLDGPQLVIAGAGSGKTRVLTYKVMHLLAHGYEPWRILVLTFTNKAAREMKERITAKVGPDKASRLWMGTFHSIFARILRQNAERIGYSANYTIYDQADARSLIKLIIKDLGLDEKVYKPAAVQNEISRAKNCLTSPAAYMSDPHAYEANKRRGVERLGEVYAHYVKRCRISGAMDFDDLLYNTAVLLRDNPDVLGHYREFFRYILVDEFQDTNFAQNYIITALSKDIGDICVVGDDAQSIYSFRGANISNILTLERAYPNLETFKLEQNYRSTQNIINAANSLIAKNKHQIKKHIFSQRPAGDRIEVQTGHSDYDEAGLVASKIVARRAITGDPWSEFAILYRTNAQSRVLEEALRRRNILYRIYGGLAFYQRKEVKDALAYFRMTVNPHDDEALRRSIVTPARGIGETTIAKIAGAAIEDGTSMWTAIRHSESLNINTRARRLLNEYVAQIQRLQEQTFQMDAEAAARYIIEQTGMLSQYLSETTPENITRVQNLEELLSGAHAFVEDQTESGQAEQTGMQDFLASISLQTDQDQNDPALADSVTLMTIHAAKGLEFSNVFVVGVEKDLLPALLSHDSDAAIEEERRLFYVAITRAKSYCMLSYAGSRYLNGKTTMCSPSPFLGDIDQEYLNCSYGARVQMPKPTQPRLTQRPISPAPPRANASSNHPIFARKPANPAPPSDARFKIHTLDEVRDGQKIIHNRFGEGQIVTVEMVDMGPAAIVKFNNEPEPRKILLAYAKFEIIG